ncbi:hypothetical protein Leryth_027506 [Lithospermum erythrorhizon]|nr:hypothetical protein Leryth_027506 [Lithospermum erythrorhizon]
MTKWHDYLVFTKAYPFIIGLIFSQTLADNTLVIVLITYLKEEWNQSLRLAAAIVNFREFYTEISKVYVAHLSDEYFGRFPAVLWLTGSYTLGLVMLWVLEAHNTYNTKMLYLALFFISLGKAGDVVLKSFISDQLRVNEPSKKVDEDLIEGRTKVWRGFPWILAAGIASFLNASWEAYSILLTIILGVELLGFWSGKPLYAYQFIETESAWKKIYYVGKAAFLKRHLPNPKSAGEFYENTKDHNPLKPNIFFFRYAFQINIMSFY